MVKKKESDIAKDCAVQMGKIAEVNEQYFVGLLWSDPLNYADYVENLDESEFMHKNWGFYFDLGLKMYKEGIAKFDRITVHMKVKEYGVNDLFTEHGKLKAIEDTSNIVGENIQNIEYYYETIKRNSVIMKLYRLFGNKVFIDYKNYIWNNLTREQLLTYWNDELNKLSLESVNNYEAENLYIDPEEFFKKLEEDSADMLPYYKSVLFNKISQGVPRGHVTMIGGFGGTGKSSIVAEKFIMSCMEKKEKLIVILNEEDAQALRQKIVLSILYNEMKTGIDRKRFVNGELTDKDKKKITEAFKIMNEYFDGDESLIKVIFMEKYIIKDLEKIVKYWVNRGYTNLLIDTHKVSDNSKHDTRWETFVEDMKTIYGWTRKNAGGMNLRTVVTFQLSDIAIRNRYLDFEAIGEGKKAKNEASIMYMFRPIWSDEYKEGKNEVQCWKLKKKENSDGYKKEYFLLEENDDTTYYFLFTPKNRFGSANDNGQAVLVLKVMMNANHFEEVGWCHIANDKSRR